MNATAQKLPSHVTLQRRRKHSPMAGVNPPTRLSVVTLSESCLRIKLWRFDFILNQAPVSISQQMKQRELVFLPEIERYSSGKRSAPKTTAPSSQAIQLLIMPKVIMDGEDGNKENLFLYGAYSPAYSVTYRVPFYMESGAFFLSAGCMKNSKIDRLEKNLEESCQNIH